MSIPATALRFAVLLWISIAFHPAWAQAPSVEMRPPQNELVTTWLVIVADDPRHRVLRVLGVTAGADGAWLLDGIYGWQGSKGTRVQGVVTQLDGKKRLELVTPADSKIVVLEAAAGVFAGTMEMAAGTTKSVRLEQLADAPASRAATGQPSAVHMVVMGGNDCPPCVAWRASELPKLQQTAAFKAIQFSYVTKSVQSPVPALVFLPDEVKPYKEQLDEAGSRRKGSPQVAIIVNGKIYDYYFGTRTAQEIEAMLLAIQGTGKYPFKRCLKVNLARQCEIPA